MTRPHFVPRSSFVFVLSCVFLATLAISPANADSGLENYFACTLKKGKSVEDLTNLVADYEADFAADGITNYNIKILAPVYASDLSTIFWYGYLGDWENLGKITAWYDASGWAPKIDKIATCSEGSLWVATD